MSTISPNLLLGLLGGALCLFGFSLYWGGVRLVGIFLGGSAGAVVALIAAYAAKLDRTMTVILVIVVALVGMAIGWRLLRKLHGVIVFFLGAGLGYLLARVILAPSYGGVWSTPWMPFAVALVGGVVGSFLFRYVIILATAALGAYLIYQAVDQPWVLAAAFIIGTLAQVGAFHGTGLHKKVPLSWR